MQDPAWREGVGGLQVSGWGGGPEPKRLGEGVGWRRGPVWEAVGYLEWGELAEGSPACGGLGFATIPESWTEGGRKMSLGNPRGGGSPGP